VALQESCRSFEGKLVLVRPHYGYGWCRLNHNEPRLTYKEASGPSEFNLRVQSFIEVEGELQGATGVVEQPGHQCNGWYVTFSLRHQGSYDFKANPPHCNISVGPEFEGGTEPTVKGMGALAGFAVISAASDAQPSLPAAGLPPLRGRPATEASVRRSRDRKLSTT
jgi:hypothetical protein